MKGLLALVATASLANAAAIKANVNNGKMSDAEVLQDILQHKWLLPDSMYRSLAARAQGISKRSPQKIPDIQDTPLPGLSNLLAYEVPKGAPKSTVPEITETKTDMWESQHSKRVKVRYGPYRIPPISEANFQSTYMNVQGMADAFMFSAKKPCSGDCMILRLDADLEYADGSAANNSNGAWLHHAVVFNSGPGVVEPTCGTGRVENIYMVGNERTTGQFSLPKSEIKSGYPLTAENSLVLSTELMNMHDKEQFVWVAVNYDIVDGHQPEYKAGRTVWMTIGGVSYCGSIYNPFGMSNLTLMGQPKVKAFSEHSVPWIAPKDGFIMSTGGHMHDGGVSIEVVRNNEVICTSKPDYSKEGGHSHGMKSKRQMPGGDHTNNDIEHIASQGICLFPEGVPFKKGDKMYIQANYDFDKHPGMKNKNGELDEVMGITGALVVW
ncbi:hypothetical protein BT63DRAFT_436803 [Microthyrium microscopicum]|uniref:Uncharacterized protein n=1 Tax=Microthyrium microscopicum TaxID=703497 RepID=A0A6A6UNB1_9PEZI|nr:hypothetical protein BT63DRAFT_436803 [Microthyrium microscopicum]